MTIVAVICPHAKKFIGRKNQVGNGKKEMAGPEGPAGVVSGSG
jgi:hypothetical protein